MTRVLITGAAGFIGSHLTEACLARGWRVTAVDCLSPYYSPAVKIANSAAFRGHGRCRYLEQDILELDLGDLLDGVDHVFHLAAQAGVRASWGEAFDVYTQSNVTVLQRLLEAARHAPLKSFVFASSSSVYGDAETLPTAEDVPLRPLSPYGATKALGEHLSYLYHRTSGVPVISLRYFSVFGPRQRPDMAFHRAIEAALGGEEFLLNGDGSQTRDFTYVDDIVDGTIRAALHGRTGATYNLGGGTRVSMNEALALIAEHTGAFTVRRGCAQLGDPRGTSAEVTRAREEIGYRPRWSLAAGVAAQVAWQRERVAAFTGSELRA